MNRKRLTFLILLIMLALLVYVASRIGESHSIRDFSNGPTSSRKANSFIWGSKPQHLDAGDVIMTRMDNATLKAELGRSSWRLLHTMTGKFPNEPTNDQRDALKSFIYLFARLYPCGDCAAHFKIVLTNNPPDVTNRESISQWACNVHNIVNKRLEKPIFDCKTISQFYKCGCNETAEAEASIT